MYLCAGGQSDQPGLGRTGEDQAKERHQGGFEKASGEHRGDHGKVVEPLFHGPADREPNRVFLVNDIAIGEQDPVAVAGGRSAPHGVVFSQPVGGKSLDVDRTNTGVQFGEPVDLVARAVCRAVIDGDQGEVWVVGCQERGEAV